MEEKEKSMRFLKPIEESISRIISDNFYLELDDILYSINISKNESSDKIIISAQNETESDVVNNSNYFENSFSLEDLISKSKPFKLCDTIDDAVDIFEDIFKASKAFLDYKKEDENNEKIIKTSIILIIRVSLPGGKEENVEFELSQKKLDKDIYINELLQLIEKLHKENEELKQENDIKNNEIKLLKNKFGINDNKSERISAHRQNKSLDNKLSMLNPVNFNTNNNFYKNFYKYGFHDIHNSTDIYKIVNYDALNNKKFLNKLNEINTRDEYNNMSSMNNTTKLFQTSIGSFLKSNFRKIPNESVQSTASKKSFELNDFKSEANIKDIKHNDKDISPKLNGTNKSDNKKKKKHKKEIELSNVIYIKNDLSKVTMVPIEDYMSIKQIKIRYCAKKCLDLKGKELYYRGKKLNDEKNLEFYKIPWESTLYVLNMPNKINVYIRSLSGKEFKIEANEFDNILQIKLKIYEFENIPLDKQIVLLNKKILDDEKCIRDLNINGDVHLIVRRKADENN